MNFLILSESGHIDKTQKKKPSETYIKKQKTISLSDSIYYWVEETHFSVNKLLVDSNCPTV